MNRSTIRFSTLLTFGIRNVIVDLNKVLKYIFHYFSVHLVGRARKNACERKNYYDFFAFLFRWKALIHLHIYMDVFFFFNPIVMLSTFETIWMGDNQKPNQKSDLMIDWMQK